MGLVDLYMRDAEMICVIAMTDVGAERPRLDTQTQALKWGSCTVGQCVILLEFIYAIKRLARNGDNHETEVGKMFLIDLERKLGQYLGAKHKNRYTIKVNHNTTAAVRRGSTLLPKREITADSSQRRNALPICRGYSQPKRIERMPDIRLDETVAVLMLLITVHSAIHASEYLQLIDPLWNIYCLESRPKLTTSSAFLFAKCADIAPKTIYTLVSQDLASEDPYMRISAVERLHRLFDHRNELLSQPYVIDPSSRGPFRSATIQMPFVISEVGSNRYTMDEPRWLTELKSAGNFPPDIRNRFRELGWGEEDEHETEMTRRAQTPLMLSWTGYLDEDYENKTNFGRTYTVLPKDRHATILIPVLNSLNLGIIDLLNDSAVGVRSAAVNFLSDYMRNEPVLFIRSFFSDIVQARPDRQRDLISRLHMLLSYSSKLPAAFAYALFNHLLGLLKWFQRNSKPQGFEMLTIVLPLLADVVSSTNDIVFKDLKRNKVDVFFAALGRFWFRPHIIPESMFPCRLTSLGHPVGSLGVPQQLFQMTMININQTQFMINFLYRYPLEERDVMASIGRFSRMPKLDAVENEAGQKLGDSQYLPDPASRRSRFTIATSRTDQNLKALSSLRARAWLCFALNLIQRMDKKRAERLQLMSIFNGVNLILLEHSSDLAIVGQALDVYVTAATRLRRFFASQNGYGLLFCALFKTYCDSEWIGVIQDTIDAAFYRFYLLHQEAFVLQSLGAIVPLMLRSISKEKSDIMAKGLFAFLSALDQPTTTCHSKALGIQSLSENFHERSSYGGAQLEIPQWILSLIPRDSKLLQNSNVLQKREFSMADSIKLFLSVIAYDPGSLRSEQFVRVLKQILPLFLDREASLMTSGMDSLIAVFARFSRSSKPLVPPSFVPPPVAPRQIQHSEGDPCDASRFSLFPSPLSKNQAIKGKTWAQNDRVAIKHEFVCLVQLYCERGEQLADVQHQLMATLVRSIVKDYTSLKIPCTTEWIRDYIKCVILPIQNLQQCSRAAIYLIIQFAHALRTHYKVIDFSGFLEGLVLIAEDDRQLLRASVDLSVVIREKITNPALAAVVKGDWAVESVHVSQVKFCSSLVELILAMINNADTDTISELEQTTPSPRFMAHVVVPLCLRFKSRFHANCLDILEMQFWLRILGLTVKAAEFDPASRRSRTAGLFAPVLNAARVTRKRASVDASNPASPQQHQAPISSLLAPPSAGISPQTPLHLRMPSLQINDNDHEVEQQQPRLVSSMNASPGLLVDFIALRIIMVRGERYLSYHPGCWLDIFNIIKKHFSAHAFVTSSLSGPTAFRLNNPSNGSGPSSPNIISTPFPVTPRAEGPVTPRHSVGGFSAFPSFLRSSSDTALLPGSVYTRDNLPATALGYILWSFAETTVFNRLPLMIMMRPFLLDQLRLLDLQPQTSSVRPSRSAGSSGTNSPAFYWPAPSFAPEEHSETSSSPILSPLHLKPDGGVNESTIGQDTASVKRKQRGERRRQWKSWNKPVQPAQTMAAFTPMRDPLHGAGARSQSPQRQWSFMSVSEQNSGGGGGSNNAPRMSVHHTRSRRHQRSDSDVKAEQVLPKILADRANRSMEHVRIMLNSSSDELTASSQFGPPMYSEKRAVSTSLSPSMALHGDRREPSHHIGTENQSSDQFLLPGKYERQPVSPGFGSMFLAREAALKAPRPTPYEGVMQGSSSFIPQHHANRMSLTVPGASMAGKAGPNQYVPHDSIGGRGSADSGNEHPYFVVEDPSHPSPPCQEAERPPLPTIHIEGSTLSTTIAVSLGAPVKKSSSILKPRIITTPSSKTVPVQTLEAAAEVTPTAERSPGPIDHQGTQSELLTDVQKAEETVLGTRVVGGRRPSLSSFDQVDYRMACLQARTKIFLQNIEEETRIVLACFPSVFSIGSVPTSTNPASATSPTTPLTQPADAANATAGAGTGAGTGAGRSGPEEEDNSGQRRGLTRFPEGEELHRTGLAHRNTTSLTVPTRTTPMITIQDQSYLAPSPINPLPSVFDADDKTIFRTSLEQAEEADKVPFLMGSSPTSSTKERRSKSVIFSRKRSVESAADVMSIPSPPSSLLWPVMPSVTSASFSNDPSSQLGSALPAFEITESSPPMPSSPSFIPVYNSTVPTDPSPSHSLYVSSSTSHSALKAVATSTSSAQSSSSTSSSSSLKYPAINVNNADTGKRQDPGVSSLMVPVIIPELLVSAPETMLRHDGDEDKTALIVPTQSRTIGLGVMNPESTRPQ
ncbi:hypothetical protein BGX28_009982 [Mortierella sp. GBA30]|nr:hypothetical protein BGX28_009982 [Mortierella sp. GBA30]